MSGDAVRRKLADFVRREIGIPRYSPVVGGLLPAEQIRETLTLPSRPHFAATGAPPPILPQYEWIGWMGPEEP